MSRLNDLEQNVPEYVVEENYDQALASAIGLSKESGGKYFKSTGSSNSLFLPFENSLIVIDDTPYEDLKKHDFVGYVNDRGVRIFHRLIKKTDDGWMAMGDNNAVEDTTRVTKENYLGRLVEPIITWK